MKSELSVLLAAMAAVIIGSGSAKATTLTFDFARGVSTMTDYSEKGVDFTTDPHRAGNFITINNGVFDADTSLSATLAPNFSNEKVKMRAHDGMPFTFTSIDMTDFFNRGPTDIILFTFTLEGGGTTSEFRVFGGMPGLHTLTFGVANVVLAEWGGGRSRPQFDNVVLAGITSTPIPATLPLFLTCLGAVGFAGWRRGRAHREGRAL